MGTLSGSVFLVFDYDGVYRAGGLAGPALDALVFLGHDDLVAFDLEHAHRARVHAGLAGGARALVKGHGHFFIHLCGILCYCC